jgi:Tol biopolymer transport system component
VDGGEPRQLTNSKEGATFPFASHDGQWIVHNVRRGDTVQIGITDRLGHRREILTDDPGVSWGYSFSSDNRRIAYAAYRESAWNIWWIDTTTRERRQLTHYTSFGSFVRSPAWRPGTEEVVYEQSEPKGNVYLLALR